MSKLYLAGLDIGTTGCKISVFSQDGTYLGNVYREYAANRSKSAHEIDAEAIWNAVRQVIKEAAVKYPEIAGIGVTSFGETFVLLDENDTPLCPAMLYTDPRGEEECNFLIEQLGSETIINITGLKPHSMYSLPKLMWIKKNMPQVYEKAKHALLIEDYIVYMLTGNAQIDYSLATRTMAFDVKNLCWSSKIFDTAEIDSSLFSNPVPTGTSAGTVREENASLGLKEDTIIVSVSHDQVAAAIGSGVFDESVTVDGAGTVECMTPVFEKYDAKEMAENNYCIVPFITPGKYVTYAFSYTGGALVKWFVDNLAGYAKETAKEKGCSVYDELGKDWSGKPTDLLVLPHFAGAATPYMDSGSKGAFVGLTISHTQQDMFLAIMEGICYEMRLNQERLRQSGVEIAPLRATGGGANNGIWLQMKADILGVPVTALKTNEAGAAGSAMLVGVAVGAFQNLSEAAEAMIEERETYYPRPEVKDLYDRNYEKYRRLYDAVRPLVIE